MAKKKRKISRPKNRRLSKRKVRTRSAPKLKTSFHTELAQVKTLKPDQYVVFKDRRGRIRNRKTRSDIKLIAEVRSRKTKKVVGYLNYVKGGKIEPRKFSVQKQAFYKARVESSVTFREVDTEYFFKIYSRESVLEQIREQAEDAIDAVYEKAQEDGFCLFRLNVQIKDFNLFSQVVNITKSTKKNDIGYFIASIIIQMLDQTSYRMSPKELSKQKKKKHARSCDCTLQILEAEGLY